MNEQNEVSRRPRYVCFHCIEGSTDPDVCSNCGAKIEEYDFDSAVITPPQKGQYRVDFSEIPEGSFVSALEMARDRFFQRFEVAMSEFGAVIQSNDIAYARLIDMLGLVLTKDVEDLRKSIIFSRGPAP